MSPIAAEIDRLRARFSHFSMDIAFTFPGQGSQFVGMGKDLAAAYPAARDVFAEVDDALGEKLSAHHVGRPGGAPDADRKRAARADGGFACRHAGSHGRKGLGFACRAIRRRPFAGRIFRSRRRRHADASPKPRACCAFAARPCRRPFPSGKARWPRCSASIWTSPPKLWPKPPSATGLVCQVANDNAPGQVVISGAKPAVDEAMRIGKDYGVRRAIPLPVSAPFHCALMQPAADRMAEALSGAALQRARRPADRQCHRRTGERPGHASGGSSSSR